MKKLNKTETQTLECSECQFDDTEPQPFPKQP